MSTDCAAEPVQLATQTGALHGTLLLPHVPDPHPVVLIVAGSGPTDRDGNSPALPGTNDCLKLLAEGLQGRGIASLRYDKRGVAASVKALQDERLLRFETLVDDAAAWLRHLRADVRFSTLGVVGHSEGSLIAVVAAGSADVAGVVSVAGAGRCGAALLREQLSPKLPPTLWQQSEVIIARLEAGHTVHPVPETLSALYRPSVQPYLISWFRYDPAREAARLRVPLLVAHGTADLQVAVHEAEILQAAAPEAASAIIEGMNHVLKSVPADPAVQSASYSDPTLPVAPELIERIAEFICSLTGASSGRAASEGY